MSRWQVWCCGWLVCGLWCGMAAGQFVAGDWVQRTEANIQRFRKTPVAFLVLDAEGKIVSGAEVRLEQQRHAFPLGLVLGESFPTHYDPEAKGWRAFNAASLANLTGWRRLQPTDAGAWDDAQLEAAMEAAAGAGLTLHWGPLVSADAFDLPEWVVPLRGEALFAAMRVYAQRVGATCGPRVGDLDVAEQTINHARLTPAMLRLLILDLRAMWPSLRPRLRFDGALEGPRTFEVVAAMDNALSQRVGIDGFTLEQAFGPRPIAQDLLEPALQRLAKFGRPLTVGSLEIGGANAIESAVNVETVLRTLFAEPTVEAIYFSGLEADRLAEPSAALFDPDGLPTAVANTIDRLFREVWWSDDTLVADELGRARGSVFLGDYRVTVTLPDGGTLNAPLRLYDRQETPADIVLMPVVNPPAE